MGSCNRIFRSLGGWFDVNLCREWLYSRSVGDRHRGDPCGSRHEATNDLNTVSHSSGNDLSCRASNEDL